MKSNNKFITALTLVVAINTVCLPNQAHAQSASGPTLGTIVFAIAGAALLASIAGQGEPRNDSYDAEERRAVENERQIMDDLRANQALQDQVRQTQEHYQEQYNLQ